MVRGLPYQPPFFKEVFIMALHEILILIIATLGTFLIPTGCEIISFSRRVNSTIGHGVICIIYGTICGIVAIAGWINILFY
jgi:hypothetical protein